MALVMRSMFQSLVAKPQRPLRETPTLRYWIVKTDDLAVERDPRITSLDRFSVARIESCEGRCPLWIFHASDAPFKLPEKQGFRVDIQGYESCYD